MFADSTGHNDLINNGFDYHFIPTPDYVSQDTALRASLAQFQTYPQNDVQGLATLVKGGPDGAYGFGFHTTQPAQVVVQPYQILSDQYGGGVPAGQMEYQPLFDSGLGS